MAKAKRPSKKKKQLRPPLSLLDQCIWWGLLLIVVASAFLLLIAYFGLQDRLFFKDGNTIAFSGHAFGVFSALPFFLLLLIVPLTFVICCLELKKPIFGNRKIRYGEYPWKKDHFPIFSNKGKKPAHGKATCFFAFAWVLCLLATLCFAGLGFYGRDCLMQDNSVVSYNMFNRQKDKVYSENDYAHLTFKASYSGKYGMGFSVRIEMEDGKKFAFYDDDFKNLRGSLEKMTELKSIFPPYEISYEGVDIIERHIEDENYSETDARMLYELFH